MFLLLLLWICPDSPRYILLNSEDLEGARTALLWYRGDPDVVEEEIKELQSEQQDRSRNHAVILLRFTLRMFVEVPNEKSLPRQIFAFSSFRRGCCSLGSAVFWYQCSMSFISLLM